jgi:hypothetical protein
MKTETVTVWFYLLGHGTGQYVARECDARLFLRLIDGETVWYAIAEGDHKGKPLSDVPAARRFKGAEYDHYE